MTIDRRIEVPFLSKFNRKSQFFDSQNELLESIIEEIGNILSTKIRSENSTELSPFSYGAKDLQSINYAQENLEAYAEECRKAILRLEPRVTNVSITKCQINKQTQTLEMEISCFVPTVKESFSTNVVLSRL